MNILWICGLPQEVQQKALDGEDYGAHSAWSWILGHLPPPPGIALHIACPVTKGPYRNRTIDYMGARFHLIRCLPGRLQTGFLLDPFFFRPLFRKLNPDVVHAWGTEESTNMIAEHLAPEKHVVQVQGVVNKLRMLKPVGKRGRHYVAFRERRTLKHARNIFCESEYSRSLVTPYIGQKTKTHVVDHPLRTAFLDADLSGTREKTILFLGRICDQKGYRDALKAFAAACVEGWSLTLVGGASESVITEMLGLIKDFGITRKVKHIPSMNCGELVETMANASIFLLPSKEDTGPTALKEAMAMGLWPVCYDNSGPKEYITRFDYGSLAKTNDIDDLTKVLGKTMQELPWQKSDCRDIVVGKVRHDLCANTIWERLLIHYSDITEASQKGRR